MDNRNRDGVELELGLTEITEMLEMVSGGSCAAVDPNGGSNIDSSAMVDPDG